MKSSRDVVVGGGRTAAADEEAIRRHDRDHRIALISAERFPPYARAPLSKGLWKGERLEAVGRYRDPEALGVDEYLGTRVVRLDRAAKIVEDQFGRRFRYDRLLPATGGVPRCLPGDPRGSSLPNAGRLPLPGAGGRNRIPPGAGAGGQVHRSRPRGGASPPWSRGDPGRPRGRPPGAHPARGPRAPTGRRVSNGSVTVFTQDTLVALAGDPERGYQATTGAGRRFPADLVVAGLGITPETTLAEAAGLLTGGRGQRLRPHGGPGRLGGRRRGSLPRSRTPDHRARRTQRERRGRRHRSRRDHGRWRRALRVAPPLLLRPLRARLRGGRPRGRVWPPWPIGWSPTVKACVLRAGRARGRSAGRERVGRHPAGTAEHSRTNRCHRPRPTQGPDPSRVIPPDLPDRSKSASTVSSPTSPKSR